MRSRNIKPGFWKNEELAEIPYEARLLFIGLWGMADREGRLEDRPKRIRAEVFPFDSINVEKLLDVITLRGFAVRYDVEGKRYIQVVNFDKHQHPHPHEARSVIPPCNDKSITSPSDVRNPDVLIPDIRISDTRKPDNPDLAGVFESLWRDYPRRIGKKAAGRHFKASVKNESDIRAIREALKRYRAECIGQEERFIAHGSTWFNKWQDYAENPVTPVRREPVKMPERKVETEEEKINQHITKVQTIHDGACPVAACVLCAKWDESEKARKAFFEKVLGGAK